MFKDLCRLSSVLCAFSWHTRLWLCKVNVGHRGLQHRIPSTWASLNYCIEYDILFYHSNPNCHIMWGMVLQLLTCWDCTFKSYWRHGCLSLKCWVLSGRGFRIELITHPEETYWMWCVLSVIAKALAHYRLSCHEGGGVLYIKKLYILTF